MKSCLKRSPFSEISVLQCNIKYNTNVIPYGSRDSKDITTSSTKSPKLHDRFQHKSRHHFSPIKSRKPDRKVLSIHKMKTRAIRNPASKPNFVHDGALYRETLDEKRRRIAGAVIGVAGAYHSHQAYPHITSG